MRKMITLFADEGKMITDGKNYGTTVQIEEGKSDEGYYEITLEEYKQIKGGTENDVQID